MKLIDQTTFSKTKVASIILNGNNPPLSTVTNQFGLNKSWLISVVTHVSYANFPINLSMKQMWVLTASFWLETTDSELYVLWGKTCVIKMWWLKLCSRSNAWLLCVPFRLFPFWGICHAPLKSQLKKINLIPHRSPKATEMEGTDVFCNSKSQRYLLYLKKYWFISFFYFFLK